MFAGSPIKRIGRNRMIRNCLIAAGNSGDPALAQAVRPHLGDPDPVIAEAARLGAGSAAAFERGDAGRLIGVDARTAVRASTWVDAFDARRRAAGRDRRRARSCVPRNWSLRPAPSRTWSAGLPKWPTSSLRGEADEAPVATRGVRRGGRPAGRRAARARSRSRRARRARARTMRRMARRCMRRAASLRQGCGAS